MIDQRPDRTLVTEDHGSFERIADDRMAVRTVRPVDAQGGGARYQRAL
jgi:hypothetical protein